MKRFSDYKKWCVSNGKAVSNDTIKEYVKAYANEQVFFGLAPEIRGDNFQQDVSTLGKLIEDKLRLFGVPDEDIYKNYGNLITMFLNWMIGFNSIAYDENKDSQEVINSYINISFNKGFYLYGNSGIGKTTFLDAISLAISEFNNDTQKPNSTQTPIFIYNHRTSVLFCPIKVRANQITRNYSIGGYMGIIKDNRIVCGGIDQFFDIKPNYGRKYANTVDIVNSGTISQVNSDYGCYPCLYIDDFSWGHTQSNTNNFGNSINVIEEVIKNRYDENMLTFATSNVMVNNMSDATADRLASQFNVIIFDRNTSFRK